MRYLDHFKILRHITVINYEEEKSDFILAKPDRYHLYYMIEVHLIINGKDWNHVAWWYALRGTQRYLYGIPARDA